MKKLVIALSNRNGCSVELSKIISNKINCSNIILKDLNIKNCIGCLSCHNQPQCVLQDDIDSINKLLVDNDLLIFITPNYFDSLSGFAKNFFDRLHPFYKFPLLENKKIIFIFIGGGEAHGTLQEMNISIKGIIKYLKFNNIQNFALQALNKKDLSNKTLEIDKIINYINNLN